MHYHSHHYHYHHPKFDIEILILLLEIRDKYDIMRLKEYQTIPASFIDHSSKSKEKLSQYDDDFLYHCIEWHQMVF